MPLVTLVTNVDDSKIPHDFNQKFTQALADAMPEKQAAYFAIHVTSSKRFTFGGNSDPAAMLRIAAFNIYTPEKNIVYSKTIGGFLSSALNITTDRILIEFSDLPASNVGFNYSTCQALMD